MDDHTEQERSRILFVDDEENVLKSLRRVFIDENFEILTAQSGKEGLEILATTEVAVIVSDQRMPGMSGAEFLEHSKQVSPYSGRIILTGHADVTTAIDAINKGGAQRYILKPWNNNDIISAVQMAAERYRLVKENRDLTILTNKQNEELKKWSSELELLVQEQTIELTYKNQELAELNTKLKRGFRNFMITISSLIELRDSRIANHSNNVARISTEVAKKIGLREQEIQDIAIAAQLHDIGKIGIPDAVLLKDINSLAPFEMHEYRKHPVRGQAAIASDDTFREAGFLIRHHHETYDGKGFPDGLTGEKIPLGSRIISIADGFDRLLSARTAQNALEEIELLSGQQFDPRLYHPLKEVVKERMEAILAATQTVEEELNPENLLSNMVLSRDVRSGTGILLVTRGTALNPRRIELLKRYYKLDPPEKGIFIWRKG